MRYHSVSSGREKDYLIHPYRIAFAQGELYLLAFVPEYDDIRTFAVSRIESVSLEKQTFTPRKDLADDVFGNSLGVYSGPTAPVEIEFDARIAPYVRARVWHPSQEVKEADGRARTPVDAGVPRLGAAQLDPGLGPAGARARAGVACQRDPVRSSISQHALRRRRLARPRRAVRRTTSSCRDSVDSSGSPSSRCWLLAATAARPLLHGLALVRRGRLPAGVRHHPADAVAALRRRRSSSAWSGSR